MAGHWSGTSPPGDDRGESATREGRRAKVNQAAEGTACSLR